MLKLRMLVAIAAVVGVVFALAVPSFAGISINGISINGKGLNGISINGISINGAKLSNANLNGLQASGKRCMATDNATLNDLSKGGLAKKN